MKNQVKKLWLLVIMMAVCSHGKAAYDFCVDGIYYAITSNENKEVEVTRNKADGSDYYGSITIPESVTYNDVSYNVTSIKQSAFSSCVALISLSIPSSVNTIEEDVFSGCSNLRELIICDGDGFLTVGTTPKRTTNGTTINVGGFYDCPLSSVYLGRNVISSIDGKGVFAESGLSTLTIGPMVTEISSFCFNRCMNLKEINFPDNVEIIDKQAFTQCSSLETIDFGNGIKEIGVSAFGLCKTLKELNLPNSLLTIGSRAFHECGLIKSVVIPHSVVSIGVEAFNCCKNIESITLGRSLAKMEYGIFNACTNVKEVYCWATTPPTIGQYDWEYKTIFATTKDTGYTPYNQNANLYVPASSVNTYRSIEPWKSFKSVTAIQIPLTALILSSHEVLMSINTTQFISCSFTPSDASNKSVIWSSSNESIVSVSNGTITANAIGEAYVYARSEENPEIMDACLVKVVVPVNGVTLSHDEYTLGVGNEFQLEASITPGNATNKKIIWSSSNENVCTVNDGHVFGHAKGTSIITATSEEGSYTAKCTISVVQPVTSIILSQNTLALHGVGASGKLTATVLPEDASNKEVTWRSSNENACMVSNGNLVAVGFGTSVIIATTVDGGHMASCTVTVDDETAITTPKESEVAYKVFNLQGVEKQQLKKGVNIIQFNDGTKKKVLVK